MDERQNAKLTVQRLSDAEREALRGMVNGESAASLADRRTITTKEAEELRMALKSRLGVLKDAEAVRMGLTAGL